MRKFSILLLLLLTACAPAEVATISFTCADNSYSLQEIMGMLDYVEQKNMTQFMCNQIEYLHKRSS